MDVKVSVVIATYNRAAMVLEAIAAALGQTMPPDEIVVSDDASTDETQVVLAGAGARLRVFRRECNSGGVENWNFAMRQARGRFLAWCSDDDRFLPDHLAQSVAYLEAHPEIGMVHSGFVDALERGGATELIERRLRARGRSLVIGRSNLMRYMTRYYDWPFHPSTLVMRREVWESTGEFDAKYALSDTDWFVRAVERFPVALLPVYGVINRRHAGNWSNRIGSARMQKEICEIVDRAIGSRWWWRLVWRNHVRLRLLLTLRARLRTGHREAADAAWHGFANDTGWRAPRWIERWGAGLIARCCAGSDGVDAERRESVSPL